MGRLSVSLNRFLAETRRLTSLKSAANTSATRLPLKLSSLGLSMGALAVGVPALALSISVSEDGIDARRLQAAPYNLTGRKIAIGQVEIGRPGQFGIDKISPPNAVVQVGRIFELDGPAIADESVDAHASNVASVMVSQDKINRGVAPNAFLYSAAIGTLTEFTGQQEECLASQHIALQNSGDVRATNFSFGEPLSRDERTDATLDGNALLTQCIDWSSRVHKLLYVVAGNQGQGGIPIPTDNFNGINVAYSTRIDGRFVRVDSANLSSEPRRTDPNSEPESNAGDRRSISLVAPGSDIEMFEPNGSRTTSSGTSFAAPHVVATVALLQEFGDRQFRAGVENWSLSSREPLVMKSVILNAADKVQDSGDGALLGMSRTLVDKRGRDWTESDAYTDQSIPLHAELGTGHLNAFRAYEQLAGGQWSPGEVPTVGWSYDSLAPENTTQEYVFTQPLKGGSYVNATLSWERKVELNSSDDYFDIGEDFSGKALSNLDLYLMPAEAEDVSQSVWSSVSREDSLEHIFIPVPADGEYKLRVVQNPLANTTEPVPYALAWWAQAVQQTAQ
ncbi:MAG: S8 family serine peptidase [Cyanobacteria bacterium P01_A01_bin.116]